MWAHGFRCCFTPLPGCFSPFPHGTGPLSVTGECLGLEGGPPCFPPGFTCPAVLRVRFAQSGGLRLRGSNPVPPAFPCRSAALPICHCAPGRQPRAVRPCNPGGANPAGHARSPVWPHPRSLAATGGISVDFSSSAYLDVSVRRVVPRRPMGSAGGRQASLPAGFAHSETRGSKAMCASPRLIAACHVLLRLPVPRHPPCAFPILPGPLPSREGADLILKRWCACACCTYPGPSGKGGPQAIRCDPSPRRGRDTMLRFAMRLSRCARARALGAGRRGRGAAGRNRRAPAGRPGQRGSALGKMMVSKEVTP